MKPHARTTVLVAWTVALAAVWAGLFNETAAITPDDRRGDAGRHDALEVSLRDAERAFARTMAERDLDGFAGFLADDTVFFGSSTVHRGKAAVVAAWTPYFDGDAAPFSWEPEAVAVLASGELGFSSGPVYDPDGERIGAFNSVWRRGEGGRWFIVFDRGCPPCSSD